MKKQITAGLFALALLNAAQAQTKQGATPTPTVETPPDPPPAIYYAPTTVIAPAVAPTPAPQQGYVYEQKLMAVPPMLYSPEQAGAIVERFKSNYPGMGSPRILIYVNRDLVDEQSGLKLSARSENVESSRTVNSGSSNSTNFSTKSTAKNTYRDNGKAAPTLADRQTVRDVERLMGRPLRQAGASLVDQRVAASLIGDRPIDTLTLENDQSRKDREAVSRIADVVVEVLISSRNVTVQEITGDKNYTVPDIQATAIRLKDSKMIGQVSASDIINRAGGPSVVARNFGVQDITEATALALMEDLMNSN